MNIKSKIMTREWFLEDLLPKNYRYFANLFLKLLIFSGVFKKNFFNWRIIALQNFVVFCHTSTRISHRYTHVPSLPSLPFWYYTSHYNVCMRSTSANRSLLKNTNHNYHILSANIMLATEQNFNNKMSQGI